MAWEAVEQWLVEHVWIAHAINGLAPVVLILLWLALVLRRRR